MEKFEDSINMLNLLYGRTIQVDGIKDYIVFESDGKYGAYNVETQTNTDLLAPRFMELPTGVIFYTPVTRLYTQDIGTFTGIDPIIYSAKSNKILRYIGAYNIEIFSNSNSNVIALYPKKDPYDTEHKAEYRVVINMLTGDEIYKGKSPIVVNVYGGPYNGIIAYDTSESTTHIITSSGEGVTLEEYLNSLEDRLGMILVKQRGRYCFKLNSKDTETWHNLDSHAMPKWAYEV